MVNSILSGMFIPDDHLHDVCTFALPKNFATDFSEWVVRALGTVENFWESTVVWSKN